MLSLHVIQAEFGDCLLLEFGTAGASKFILIDGGPPNTFQDHLKPVLQEKVLPAGGRLERVILSHVDNDHIAGLLDLFAEIRVQHDAHQPELVSIGGLWHNSFAATVDPDGTLQPRAQALMAVAGARNVMGQSDISVKGIAEGNSLRIAATLLNIPLNADASDPMTVESAPNPVQFGNLTLTVVGPTESNLDNLRAEWLQWLDDHEGGITAGDFRVMANADKSIPNLSSICVLAEAQGKRVLLTGDQRSDFILEGLEARGLLDQAGGAHFDLLKAPHHGSDRNITRTFFKKITADIYVFSANGKDGNPDLATLIWLVEAVKEQHRHPEIIVTNGTPSTNKLLQEYPAEEYGYSLRIMPADRSSLEINLT
jgi:hypothetical protein